MKKQRRLGTLQHPIVSEMVKDAQNRTNHMCFHLISTLP